MTCRTVGVGIQDRDLSLSLYLPTVLHHIHPELENVPTADLASWALLGSLAQSLVVDKSSVTGLRILKCLVRSQSLSKNVNLEIEFSVLIPKQSVITG